MLDFNNLPAKADIRIYVGMQGVGATIVPVTYFAYEKPKDSSILWILFVPPSGGGGPGVSAASGTTRGGSSGGSGTGVFNICVPSAWMPSVIYGRISSSGARRNPGDAAFVAISTALSYTPEFTPTFPSVFITHAGPSSGSPGTSAGAGGVAASGSFPTINNTQLRMNAASTQGLASLVGASAAVGVGSALPGGSEGLVWSGAGGGAVNTDDVGKSGGGQDSGSLLHGPVVGGLPGQDGADAITIYNQYGIPIYAIPSSGGGSSGTGTGGRGGNGSVGAAGSGGGAGVTGGQGGAGGGGLIAFVSLPWV